MKGMDNDLDFDTPVAIFEDNQGEIALSTLSKNPVCQHVDIKYHCVRSAVSDGRIVIEYCLTADMVADIFIKPATKVTMERFMYFIFGVG